MYTIFDLIRPEDKARNVPPRYNIAPTQDVLYVIENEGQRFLQEGRWWLVPHWAKEIPKYSLFNARSEDAHNKPAFRDAFRWGRCLIPADGYYEWTKNEEDGKKDPHLIHLQQFEPFAFAGLWAYNQMLDIRSCTILTATAVPEISHLHNRMPVVLNENSFDDWLNQKTTVEEARQLMNDTRGPELISYRVDRAVGYSKISDSRLIERIETND